MGRGLAIGCLALAGAGLGLMGCASKPWVEDPDNELARVQLVEAVAPVSAAQLFPLRSMQGLFRVVEGDDDGVTQPYSLQQENGDWVFTVAGATRTFYHLDEAGNLRILREDDLDEEVSVTYDPSLIVLPAHWPGPATAEQTVQMTVRDLDDMSIRTTGVCASKLEWVGSQQVKTPAGAFPALLVRMTRLIQLPIAQVEVEVLTAYHPQEGQVAERVTQTTRALGLLSLEDIREIRLAR